MKGASKVPELLSDPSILFLDEPTSGLDAFMADSVCMLLRKLANSGKIVICVSLGDSSVLRYCWRKPGSSTQFGKSIDINVDHGDIYIMSEKATGYDWKSRSKYRLVHAAGHSTYLNHK